MNRLAEISENANFNEWRIVDANDLVEDYYSIFLNNNGYVIYEHWVTRNWLRKPAGNFMLRIGDIIEQFVVPHPRYKLNYNN